MSKKTNGDGVPVDTTTVDPQAYQRILGATFAGAEHKAVITIGRRSWSKWQLGRIGCPHPAAAVRVARVLKLLAIDSPADFLKRAHELGRYKALGVTSYWVVLALARDLGADIDAVHGDDRSFNSVHHEALKTQTTGPARRRRRR